MPSWALAVAEEARANRRAQAPSVAVPAAAAAPAGEVVHARLSTPAERLQSAYEAAHLVRTHWTRRRDNPAVPGTKVALRPKGKHRHQAPPSSRLSLAAVSSPPFRAPRAFAPPSESDSTHAEPRSSRLDGSGQSAGVRTCAHPLQAHVYGGGVLHASTAMRGEIVATVPDESRRLPRRSMPNRDMLASGEREQALQAVLGCSTTTHAQDANGNAVDTAARPLSNTPDCLDALPCSTNDTWTARDAHDARCTMTAGAVPSSYHVETAQCTWAERRTAAGAQVTWPSLGGLGDGNEPERPERSQCQTRPTATSGTESPMASDLFDRDDVLRWGRRGLDSSRRANDGVGEGASSVVRCSEHSPRALFHEPCIGAAGAPGERSTSPLGRAGSRVETANATALRLPSDLMTRTTHARLSEPLRNATLRGDPSTGRKVETAPWMPSRTAGSAAGSCSFGPSSTHKQVQDVAAQADGTPMATAAALTPPTAFNRMVSNVEHLLRELAPASSSADGMGAAVSEPREAQTTASMVGNVERLVHQLASPDLGTMTDAGTCGKCGGEGNAGLRLQGYLDRSASENSLRACCTNAITTDAALQRPRTHESTLDAPLPLGQAVYMRHIRRRATAARRDREISTGGSGRGVSVANLTDRVTQNLLPVEPRDTIADESADPACNLRSHQASDLLRRIRAMAAVPMRASNRGEREQTAAKAEAEQQIALARSALRASSGMPSSPGDGQFHPHPRATRRSALLPQGSPGAREQPSLHLRPPSATTAPQSHRCAIAPPPPPLARSLADHKDDPGCSLYSMSATPGDDSLSMARRPARTRCDSCEAIAALLTAANMATIASSRAPPSVESLIASSRFDTRAAPRNREGTRSRSASCASAFSPQPPQSFNPASVARSSADLPSPPYFFFKPDASTAGTASKELLGTATIAHQGDRDKQPPHARCGATPMADRNTCHRAVAPATPHTCHLDATAISPALRSWHTDTEVRDAWVVPSLDGHGIRCSHVVQADGFANRIADIGPVQSSGLEYSSSLPTAFPMRGPRNEYGESGYTPSSRYDVDVNDMRDLSLVDANNLGGKREQSSPSAVIERLGTPPNPTAVEGWTLPDFMCNLPKADTGSTGGGDEYTEALRRVYEEFCASGPASAPDDIPSQSLTGAEVSHRFNLSSRMRSADACASTSAYQNGKKC
eukprot:scaffold102666_cov32-Tisochrysis_lutea.AAC.2